MSLKSPVRRMTNTYVWVCLTCMYTLPSLVLSTEEPHEKLTTGTRLIRSLDDARTDIHAMTRTIASLDDELANKQKRTCNIGVNSHFCALADLDSKIRSREWLNSIYSPGKRSMEDMQPEKDDTDDITRELKELLHKRINLAKLKALLRDADQDIVQQRKRTCKVEVGGTCRTEWASSIADQYYYLLGPHSPGRRRRRSPIRLFKRKITTQKLFGKPLM
ncbi:uncharacterized protein LOC117336100 isoform X1 [Pecten maximus]|uniref:uncharacterized protein LOC117336100 isoform X1 n=2 Tax=Pecten maximus TaxID=6579 RepID=UPI0014582596|nr:uncharacterized protein LOC117336100 isoform X1 [Pecten maximus]